MPRRLFDFECENSHLTESYVDIDTTSIPCKVCQSEAKRKISAPATKLEPYSGAFPGAYYDWNRKRAEKMAQEKKKADS